MPIYSYMRLSTDEDKQSNSFEIQSHVITKYAKENGLEPILKTFKDAKSGAKLEQRTGLMEMLNTIKKDDKVIVHKIDRLSRDVLQMGWIRTELARKGCELIIIDSKNDTDDPMANLMEQIVTAFADYERQMIKSRIQATMDLKKSKGVKLGGAIPYGYDVIEQDKKKVLVKNEVEQKIIASIKRYKSKGLSLGAIAKKLNERGITTKKGKEFQSMQVKRILEYKHTK